MNAAGSSGAGLAMVNASTLTEVARHVTGRPGLSVADWHTQVLHGGIARTTGGAFHLNGTGHDPDGEHSWSAVLKLAQPVQGADNQTHYGYWRRELLVIQTGQDVLPTPADGLHAPAATGRARIPTATGSGWSTSKRASSAHGRSGVTVWPPTTWVHSMADS